MRKIALIIAAALCMALGLTLAAEDFGGRARIDRTVHDFGNVSLKDGPLRASFTVTNISNEPLTIYAVVSSCGCTNVEWTHETIAPGASGVISATYSNDEGPYPFDKVLTAYLSDIKKPIVLHLKGVVKKNKK